MSLPSVLWRCWLGGRKGIWPVKTKWWGAGVVVCLEQGADMHMTQLMPLPLTVSCFSKIQIGFTFLVPAHLGGPGKGPLNGCVCMCVFLFLWDSCKSCAIFLCAINAKWCWRIVLLALWYCLLLADSRYALWGHNCSTNKGPEVFNISDYSRPLCACLGELHRFLLQDCPQYFDTVGWAAGRASGL